MNKVILLGNLTRDPEVKYTASNMAIANIGLAVNETWKDKDGNKQQATSFFDCTAFGSTGENIAKFFAKGSRILIDGKLKQETWDDKASGAKRSKVVIIVERFDFVDSKGDKAPAAAGATRQQAPWQPDEGDGFNI